MPNKRVMLVRPKYRSPTGLSISTPPHAHVRTRSPTTTNVVSVGRHAGAAASAHASTHVREGGEAVLETFKALSQTERKKVLDAMLLEQQMTTATPAQREVAMWATAVHREFTAVVGAGDGGLVGIGVVQKAVAVGTSWQHVKGFMEASRLQSLTVTERQSVYYLLAQMLVRHARKAAAYADSPLTLKVVVNCTGALPGLFEQAFPGYVAAGLAPVVARQAALAVAR